MFFFLYSMLVKSFNFDFVYGCLMLNALHVGHSKENSILQASQFFFKVFYNFVVMNLLYTALFLKRSLSVFFSFFKKKGDFWFMNTESGLKDYISLMGLKCGELFLNAKWVAGNLTNFKQVTSSVNSFFFFKKFAGHKDSLFFDSFSGFLFWTAFPKSVLLLQPVNNYLVPMEMISLNFLGAISLVDTNVNSNSILYSIPSNDDSFRSLIFLSKVFSVKIILSKLSFLLYWVMFSKNSFLSVLFKFSSFSFLKKMLKVFLPFNKNANDKVVVDGLVLSSFSCKSHILTSKSFFLYSRQIDYVLFSENENNNSLLYSILNYKSYEDYVSYFKLSKYGKFGI